MPINNPKQKKTNGAMNFLKKLTLRRTPTFKLQEEYFLVERENFFTGLWRAIRMFVEYMKGFYAFKNVGNCVTIFGSARFPESSAYYYMAREVGKLLAFSGFTVMTGGGPGIMEAANRGAKEACGKSVSCNISSISNPSFEKANMYVDKCISLRYFFVRKVMLTKYSSAYIFMPGGIGTLDELFEMATLIQTGKVKNFPVVLMGKSYWQPLLDFLTDTLLKNNTIEYSDMQRLNLTDSPEEAIQLIKNTLATINNHSDHDE